MREDNNAFHSGTTILIVVTIAIAAAVAELHKITPEQNVRIQKFCRNPDFWQPDPFQTKVLGGLETSPGKYPWAVAFYAHQQGIAFCGGTLISPRHVLTARHCVHTLVCIERGQSDDREEPIRWWIQVGGVCTKADPASNCSVPDMQRVRVRQAIYSTRNLHSCDSLGDVQPDALNADFAIVELAEDLHPVPFVPDQGRGNNKLQVACLPSHPQLAPIHHIYGWGYTKRTNSSSMPLDYDPATHLMEIQLTTVQGNDTVRVVPEQKLHYCQSPRLICAHDANSSESEQQQQDSAQGDSGNGIVGMHEDTPLLDAITVSGLPNERLHIGLRLYPLEREICHYTGVCQRKQWQNGAQLRSLWQKESGILKMDEVYTYRGGGGI